MSQAERVRTLRRAAGWSQVDLAVKSGLSPSTIQRVERGATGGHIDTLENIAQALGVTVDQLRGSSAPAAAAS